ncbi:MAG: hypothetical protein QM698_12055 [Micropepsaceae bacterium]
MNARVTPGLFSDIALRIQCAVADLRAAVQDGSAADPAAAADLADRMERYAESVLAGDVAEADLGGQKVSAAGF